MYVKNEKELGKALQNNADEIVMELKTGKTVIKIKATGEKAFRTLILCMGVVIPLIYATVTSGGIASPVTVPAATIAMATPISLIGAGTCFSAATIATGAVIAAGGLASITAGAQALKKLRNYDLIQKGDKVILKRKK